MEVMHGINMDKLFSEYFGLPVSVIPSDPIFIFLSSTTDTI
jgi:hypothetical protein